MQCHRFKVKLDRLGLQLGLLTEKEMEMIQHPERTGNSYGHEDQLTEDLIVRLDTFIEILLTKDRDVEQARVKVTQDVEKLIQNQESFERRVAEMDSVYAMLMSEKGDDKVID